MPFMDTRGPPMEKRRGADEIGTGLQGDTPRRLDILQLRNAGEVPVDQHGVRQRPQVLSWLQFGRVRRQEEQVDMLGHAHLGTGMPARPVEDEHDLFGWPRADRAREGFQLHREELSAHRRCEMPHGAPRSWMHKADEVAPVIPMLDRSNWSLAG